jgi:hypothetical protein
MSDSLDHYHFKVRFSEQTIEKINFLQESMGLENKSTAVALAVAFIDFFNEARSEGAEIKIEHLGGTQSRITSIWKSANEMPEEQDNTEKTLLTVALREGITDTMWLLRFRTGLKNVTIVLANAITFMADVIRLQNQGAAVYAEYPDGKRRKLEVHEQETEGRLSSIPYHKKN